MDIRRRPPLFFVAVAACVYVLAPEVVSSFVLPPLHSNALNSRTVAESPTQVHLWLSRRSKRKKEIPIQNITSAAQLDAHWNNASIANPIRTVRVVGATQSIGNPDLPEYTHPVVQLLHDRRRNGRRSNAKDEQCKIALAVEGGGMRGCVSAGMICAVHYLNLTASLDAVYGASAGTVVGSYLITEQLRYSGPEVYYDQLTTAGREFIDTRRLLRAVGLGGLDVKGSWKQYLKKLDLPVLQLDFLLKRTMQETKPLDWERFSKRQSTLPMNVVASGLETGQAHTLNMKKGAFENLEELANCMHASCLLPGIAGPVMNIHKNILRGEPVPAGESKFIRRNNLSDDRYEPFADSLLYEPLPFETACKSDGITHCVVVRSRPDGVDVTGSGGGLGERLLAHRFFRRKNPSLRHQYRRMRRGLHKKRYAESILKLNQESTSTRDPWDTTTQDQPHLLSIALTPGSPEVGRLEVDRETIYMNMRRGFARAYDCLVEDPALRGRGMEEAEQYFTDEILAYDPRDRETGASSIAPPEKQQPSPVV